MRETVPDRRDLTGPPAGRRHHLAIAVVFAVNGAGLGVWAAFLPSLRRALDLGEGALGVALLTMAAGAIATMPLVGRLIERVGGRSVIRLAGTGFALCLVLPHLAPSWALLLPATLLLGAMNGALDVAQSTHGTVLERRAGRPVMSSLNGFFSLGGAVGAGVSALLLGAGTAAPAAVAGLAALLAATVLAASLALLDDRTGGGETRAAAATPGPRRPHPLIVRLGLLALVAVLVEWAIMDWSAIFVVEVLEARASRGAAAFAAFSLGMMAGRFGGDPVVASLGPDRVLALSGALATAGLALAVAATGPLVAIPGFALAGLGIANLFPVLISAAARIPGVPAGRGVAAVAMLAYAGGLIGPVLIGFGAQGLGLRAALACLVPGALLLALAGAARRLEPPARAASQPGSV